MGMMGNMDRAQAMPNPDPCHQMEMPEERDMEKNCGTCTKSEALWSLDFIFPDTEIVVQDFPQVFPSLAWFGEERSWADVLQTSIPSLPDDIASMNAHLIVTRSTIFRL